MGGGTANAEPNVHRKTCSLIWRLRFKLGMKSSWKSLAYWLYAAYTVKKTGMNKAMNPRNPPLQSTLLLDQLRERVRYLHYSLSTEKVYLYWVRFFYSLARLAASVRHGRT